MDPQPNDTSAERRRPAPLLTAEDVARDLNISKWAVYEFARSGVLPSVRIGRVVRFKPEAIRKFIEDGGFSHAGGWRKEPSLA